jgi:hypothetical protein
MNQFTLFDLPNKAKKSVTIADSKSIDAPIVQSTPVEINDSAVRVNKEKIAPPRIDVIPSLKKTITDNIGSREVLNKFGEITIEKVGEFPEVGKIRLSGEYSQNFVDFPKFGLNITPLSDISFRFILSIKKTIDDTNPTLFTSKTFYDELVNAYVENNPYFVANVIKQQAIVTVLYDDLLKKIEQFRTIELNVGKVGVVVNKNLFVDSNYTLINGAPPPSLKANPTINLEDLVKYVDWVVSKPAINYDDRLLNEREIGDWSMVNPNEKASNTEIVKPTTPPVDEPPPTVQQRQHPPIGRKGFYEGEEITASDKNRYTWTNLTGGRWLLQGPATPTPGGNNTGTPTGTGGRPQL